MFKNALIWNIFIDLLASISVPVFFFSVALLNIMTKSNLRRKGFVWLTDHIQSINDGSQGRKLRTAAETKEECCLLPYFLWLSLCSSGPPALGWSYPKQVQISYLNFQSRQQYKNLTTSQFDGDSSSTEIPSSWAC